MENQTEAKESSPNIDLAQKAEIAENSSGNNESRNESPQKVEGNSDTAQISADTQNEQDDISNSNATISDNNLVTTDSDFLAISNENLPLTDKVDKNAEKVEETPNETEQVQVENISNETEQVTIQSPAVEEQSSELNINDTSKEQFFFLDDIMDKLEQLSSQPDDDIVDQYFNVFIYETNISNPEVFKLFPASRKWDTLIQLVATFKSHPNPEDLISKPESIDIDQVYNLLNSACISWMKRFIDINGIQFLLEQVVTFTKLIRRNFELNDILFYVKNLKIYLKCLYEIFDTQIGLKAIADVSVETVINTLVLALIRGETEINMIIIKSLTNIINSYKTTWLILDAFESYKIANCLSGRFVILYETLNSVLNDFDCLSICFFVNSILNSIPELFLRVSIREEMKRDEIESFLLTHTNDKIAPFVNEYTISKGNDDEFVHNLFGQRSISLMNVKSMIESMLTWKDEQRHIMSFLLELIWAKNRTEYGFNDYATLITNYLTALHHSKTEEEFRNISNEIWRLSHLEVSIENQEQFKEWNNLYELFKFSQNGSLVRNLDSQTKEIPSATKKNLEDLIREYGKVREMLRLRVNKFEKASQPSPEPSQETPQPSEEIPKQTTEEVKMQTTEEVPIQTTEVTTTTIDQVQQIDIPQESLETVQAIQQQLNDIKDMQIDGSFQPPEFENIEEPVQDQSCDPAFLPPPPPPPPPPPAKKKQRDFQFNVFHAGKINPAFMQSTYWATMDAFKDDVEIDEKAIREAFQINPKGNVVVTKKDNSTAVVNLLDNKKRTIITIFLKGVKRTTTQIAETLLSMNSSNAIPLDLLDSLKHALPEDSDYQTIDQYTGSRDLLGQLEQFYLGIKHIKMLPLRIDLLLFSQDMEADINGKIQFLNLLEKALDEISNSQNLPVCFGIILKIVNTLFVAARKSVIQGFPLNNLTLLYNFRAVDDKNTMMNYIATLATTKYPCFLELRKDLPSVPQAYKIDLQSCLDVVTPIRSILNQINEKQKELSNLMVDDELNAYAARFKVHASKLVDEFDQKLNSLNTKFEKLTQSYGENEMKPPEFLSYFSDFMDKLDIAITENQKSGNA